MGSFVALTEQEKKNSEYIVSRNVGGGRIVALGSENLVQTENSPIDRPIPSAPAAPAPAYSATLSMPQGQLEHRQKLLAEAEAEQTRLAEQAVALSGTAEWDRINAQIQANRANVEQLQASIATSNRNARANEAARQAEEYASRKDSPNAKYFVQQGENNADNIVQYSRDNWGKIAYDESKGIHGKGKSVYRHMTEDEVNTYNYILGKDGADAANAYLSALEETLNKREGERQAEQINSYGGVGGAVAKGIYSLSASSQGAMEGVRQNFNEEALPTTSLQYGSGKVREGLSGVGAVAYDTLGIVGNMLPAMIVTGGLGIGGAAGKAITSGLIGLGARGNAYSQALKEGYTKEQASTYGTLIGAAEGGLSYLLSGISAAGGVADDVLIAKLKGIDNAFAKLAIAGIRVGSEVTEEELQLILEPTLRSLILNEEYSAPTWNDVAYTALLSALSVGVMEGAPNAYNFFNKTAQDIKNKRSANPLAPATGNEVEATTDAPETNAAQIAENEAQTPAAEAPKPTPNDPLVDAILGGKRVNSNELSGESFAALSERSDVGIDAKGNAYLMDEAQHIDQRDYKSVGDRKVNAFQFDHPELHNHMVVAAQDLLNDAATSVSSGKYTETVRTHQGKKRYQRIAETRALRKAMEEAGLSRNQIIKAAEDLVANHGQENYAAAKRLELVLDEMLANGYTTLDGRNVHPNEAYIKLKNTLVGSLTPDVGSFEEFVKNNQLNLDLGETTMDELRAEYDALHANDGVGAANAGSLTTAYDELQEQSTQFHPVGANATTTRVTEVPTTDFDGRNISKSASTILGAEAIPDDVVPLIENLVASGSLSYDKRSDARALDRARETIVDSGFDGAMERFRNLVNSGKVSKDIVALGQTLLNNAANSGNGNAVAELCMLYQSLSTNVGQSLQAMSILRKMSPESQLYGITKTVNSLNGLIAKTKKDFAGAKIDQALIDEFLAQKDQAGRDAVMEKIYQNIADQVPSTFADKWNSWRYMSMLVNLRTHVRNVAGNTFFQPVRLIKNEIAAGLESMWAATGHDIQRTKSFSASPAMYKAAWADFDNVKKTLGGNKYSDTAMSEIQDKRKIYKNKALEFIRSMNMEALSAEDAIFKRITYADSLAGYLKANGVTAEQMQNGTVSEEVLSAARDYAANEALKATYQDSNALSDFVSGINRAAKSENKVARAASVVGEAALPFKRTPANVLVRSLEYSPAGLAKALTYDLAKVKKGDMTVSQAFDNIAAGTVGTAIFGLGALLFAKGILRGKQGDDEEDKFDELLGHQGYAVEFEDGTSITLDWLAPAAMPLFMGAELMSSLMENGFSAQDIVDTLYAMSDPLLEMSMLQSLNDMIESVSYAKTSGVISVIGSAISSYFSQAIPTVFGQIERIGETERMSAYTDKNSPLPTDLQYFLSKASAKLPGIDYQQIPYIDAWGRTEETGNIFERVANNMLNPAYVSQVDIDAVEAELQKVYDATGESGVLPARAERSIDVNGETKNLTAEQYTKYAQSKGQKCYQYAKDAMATAEYKRMSPEDKASYITKMYAYADYKAKREIFSNAASGNTEMQRFAEAERQGISPVEWYNIRDDINNFHDTETQTRKEQVVDYINDQNLTEIQKDWLYLWQYKETTLDETPWH